MDLISVIVPVYNVEDYLDRCIQSIVGQIYQNLEIILVDDGSPDRCGEICDTWAEKDNRIKVIHKENGGVSAARNAGLDAATGTYVCFVDSDDWIARSFVEQLHSAIVAYHASISVCKMQKLAPGEKIHYSSSDPEVTVYSREEAMASLVNGGVFEGGACDKLYRADVIGSHRFPEGMRHEDEVFTHNVVDCADRLVYVNTVLYYYFQLNNSFMHTITPAHLDMLDACLDRIELVTRRYPALIKNAKASFCVLCVAFCREALQYCDGEIKLYTERIAEKRRSLRFTFRELLAYQPKQILYITASRICLIPFAKLLNFRNGGK